MDEKFLQKVSNDLDILKNFLVLLLRHQGVTNKDIADSLGISEGRLSQLMNPGKYKKIKKENKDLDKT
jgi:DNA-binding Xre family transcriptional regulator